MHTDSGQSRESRPQMMIYQAMINVMKAVEPIAKNRRNQAQGYQFRGIDDVYAALQQIMASAGVFTTSRIIDVETSEKQTKSGGTTHCRLVRFRFRFHALDGSSVVTEVIGEGHDSGDKASNKAMSVAHKYALLQAFCIPTSDPKDPEDDSGEHRSATTTQEPAKTAPIYTGTTEQKIKLAGLLRNLGIDPSKYDAISEKLMGRPATDWKTVAQGGAHA
jgi:hypothetical protein